jgi:SPP1 family predicted phage head-tail adaptor
MARKPIIQPGELDRRVVIQAPPSPTASQDDYGEPDAAWSTLDTRWAKIEPVGGDEYFDGLQFIAKATTKVTMRYLSTATPGCRVQLGSRTLYVGYVENMNNNDWLTVLVCGELVAA